MNKEEIDLLKSAIKERLGKDINISKDYIKHQQMGKIHQHSINYVII